MTLLTSLRCAATLVALLVAVGCNKAPAPTTEAVGGSPALSVKPPDWVPADEWKRVEQLRSDCKVTADTRSLADCKQFGALTTELRKGGIALTQLFPAVAYGLASPDPEHQVVATELLGEAYQKLDGVVGTRLSAPAVESMINRFLQSQGTRAVRIAQPVALIATLAEQETLLHAAIKQHPEALARQNAYRALLHHGGPASMKLVQDVALAESEMDALAAVGAFSAISNFRFRELAAQICPWVENLSKRSGDVFHQRAVTLWMNCQGPHIDSAVDLVKKNASSSEAGRYFAALGNWCKPPGDHARCAEVRTMLLKAWNSKKLDDDIRLSALQSLSAQWSDKQVLAALNEAAKSTVVQIKIAGETALRRLEALRPAAETLPVSAPKPAK